MADKRFWLGMTYRADLKRNDKLMVGNVDSEEPDYIDLTDILKPFDAADFKQAGLATQEDIQEAFGQTLAATKGTIGIATTFTTPADPAEDGNYVAKENGTYSNADGIQVNLSQGYTVINKKGDVFTKIVVPINMININGFMYQSRAAAEAIAAGTPAPNDGVTFKVSKDDAANAGEYQFLTSAPSGLQFVNPFIEITPIIGVDQAGKASEASQVYNKLKTNRVNRPFTGQLNNGKLLNNSGVLVDWGSGKVSDFQTANPAYNYVFTDLGYTASSGLAVAWYAEENEASFISGVASSISSASPIIDTNYLAPPVGANYYRLSYDGGRGGAGKAFVISNQYLKDLIESYKLNTTSEIKIGGTGVPISDAVYQKLKENRVLKIIEGTSASGKLLNNSGVLVDFGSGRTTDFQTANPAYNYVFTDLGYKNSSGLSVAWYADETEASFISGIASSVSSASPILDTGYISPPPTANYYKLSYDLSRGGSLAKTFVVSNQYLKDLIDSLTATVTAKADVTALEVDYSIVGNNVPQKLIGANGDIIQWGTGTVTAFQETKAGYKHSFYNLGKLASNSGTTLAVAWYSDETEESFISGIIASKVDGAPNNTYIGNVTPPENTKYFRLAYDSSLGGNPKVKVISSQYLKDINTSAPTAILSFDGDSIAASFGASFIDNITLEEKVQRRAIGGETTLDTLFYLGVYPYMVQPFTIPADTSQVVVDFSSFFGFDNVYDPATGEVISGEGSTFVNPYGTRAVEIAGVKGTMIYKRGGDETNHYFKRIAAGEAVTLTRPTNVVPQVIDRNVIPIVCMGTNDGWDYDHQELPRDGVTLQDADNLVNYYKLIRASLRPTSNNYLFLGFYQTGFADQQSDANYKIWWDYFTAKMEETFGLNFFNVKEYLRSYGWKDAGYQLGFRLTESGYTQFQADIDYDINQINRGRVPDCVLGSTGATHTTARVSAAVANQIAKRLKDLGLIKSYTPADINAIVDAENADINEPDYTP